MSPMLSTDTAVPLLSPPTLELSPQSSETADSRAAFPLDLAPPKAEHCSANRSPTSSLRRPAGHRTEDSAVCTQSHPFLPGTPPLSTAGQGQARFDDSLTTTPLCEKTPLSCSRSRTGTAELIGRALAAYDRTEETAASIRANRRPDGKATAPGPSPRLSTTAQNVRNGNRDDTGTEGNKGHGTWGYGGETAAHLPALRKAHFAAAKPTLGQPPRTLDTNHRRREGPASCRPLEKKTAGGRIESTLKTNTLVSPLVPLKERLAKSRNGHAGNSMDSAHATEGKTAPRPSEAKLPVGTKGDSFLAHSPMCKLAPSDTATESLGTRSLQGVAGTPLRVGTPPRLRRRPCKEKPSKADERSGKKLLGDNIEETRQFGGTTDKTGQNKLLCPKLPPDTADIQKKDGRRPPCHNTSPRREKLGARRSRTTRTAGNLLSQELITSSQRVRLAFFPPMSRISSHSRNRSPPYESL